MLPPLLGLNKIKESVEVSNSIWIRALLTGYSMSEDVAVTLQVPWQCFPLPSIQTAVWYPGTRQTAGQKPPARLWRRAKLRCNAAAQKAETVQCFSNSQWEFVDVPQSKKKKAQLLCTGYFHFVSLFLSSAVNGCYSLLLVECMLQFIFFYSSLSMTPEKIFVRRCTVKLWCLITIKIISSPASRFSSLLHSSEDISRTGHTTVTL